MYLPLFVYGREEYIMDLSARDKALPVRWVAPECMIHGIFNSKSMVSANTWHGTSTL